MSERTPERPAQPQAETPRPKRSKKRRPPPDALNYVEGLAPREIDRRIQLALRWGDLCQRTAGAYLAEVEDRGLHAPLSYGSFRDYASRGLGRSATTLAEYARAARALRDAPSVDAAFSAGRLNWSAVRALTRVVVPETEEAWVAWAWRDGRPRGAREVAQHASVRRNGDLPTDPEKRRLHQNAVELRAKLSPEQSAVWGLLREVIEQEQGVEVGCLSDAAIVLSLAYEALERRERPVPTTLRPANPALDPRNTGPLVPLVERAAKTSASLRAVILRRDKGACRGCGRKSNLGCHHLVWRRYGGATEPDNLVTLCERCHSLVHDRYLVALGTVDALQFVCADGEPQAGPTPLPVEVAACETPVEPPPSPRRRGEAEDATADELTPCVPAVSGVPVPEARLVRLEDVPAVADVDWWRRHRDRFVPCARGGGLRFEPGFVPLEVPPAEPRAPAPGPGLDGLIGQERVRASLGVALAATRQTGEQLGHVLLTGAAGLGKSTFAAAIAHELGAPLQTVLAPSIEDPDLLVRQLASLPRGGVLFVDEVHRLSKRAAEALYEALANGRIDLPIRSGWEQRTLRIELQPFTLVAATTEEGLLPEPLRSRFVYQERLALYELGALKELVDRAFAARGLKPTAEARRRIARAARGTPRRCLTLVQAVCDEARARGEARVRRATVAAALARIATAPSGVAEPELAYLRVLAAANKPVGVKVVASHVGSSPRNVREVHEPFLLREGLVRLTPRGRVITKRGRRALAEAERSRDAAA